MTETNKKIVEQFIDRLHTQGGWDRADAAPRRSVWGWVGTPDPSEGRALTSTDSTTARKNRFGTRDLVATFGNGRTCASGECTTVLSQYNHEDRCGVHDATRARP